MTQTEIDTEIKELKHKLFYFLYGAIMTIIVVSFIQKCTPEANRTTTTVTTKTVTGKFQSQKPINKPIGQKTSGQNLSKNDKSKGKQSTNDNFNQSQDSLISELLAENEKLSRDYYLQSDSIKRGLYEKAIRLNKFSQTFDDQYLKIDVYGVSRGTVESMKADYTIKPQKQEVPIKKRVFALKTGVEYGNTTTLSNSVFKGNLEFENKKGNSFSFSYDTDSRYWLGYKKTIFEIKR